MTWVFSLEDCNWRPVVNDSGVEDNEMNLPCWSLAALLQRMPSAITVDGDEYIFALKKTVAYMAFYEVTEGPFKTFLWEAGDPVDILCAMLLELDERGLLWGARRLRSEVAMLKKVAQAYSGLTIENIIGQLEARIKEIEKEDEK